MTTETHIPPLTEEIANQYLVRVHDDMLVESRVKEICKKVSELYSDVFRFQDKIPFTCTCYFDIKNRLLIKLRIAPDYVLSTGELPTSCLWNDTDLHINLQLMKSDFEAEYIKFKKKQKEIDDSKPPSLFKKIKSWF